MATTNVRSGDAMMLFVGGNPIAVATGHSITCTTDFQETSSKDSGVNKLQEVNGTSWECNTENLFTDKDYKTLFDAWHAGTKVSLKFGYVSNYTKEGLIDAGGTYAGPWTMGGSYLYGYAFISNLASNANHGEKATFSATFKGDGQLASYGTWL